MGLKIKKGLFHPLYVLFIIALIFSSLYDFKKTKDINKIIYGEHSSKYYDKDYKEIDLEIKELKKYEDFLYKNRCSYRLKISPSFNYKNMNEKRMDYLLSFNCNNLKKFEYKYKVNKSKKDIVDNIEIYFFSFYDEVLISKNELNKYSKNDVLEVMNSDNFKMFIKNVDEILQQEKEKLLIIEKNKKSWE